MESFLHFCRYIQTALSEEQIVGVLIYDRKLNDQHAHFPLIIQKKLRGFRGTNHIGFSVFVDCNHVFNVLADNGTTVILFFSRSPFIKKYGFPLNESQWAEIKKWAM
jgi:hypothetical protein